MKNYSSAFSPNFVISHFRHIVDPKNPDLEGIANSIMYGGNPESLCAMVSVPRFDLFKLNKDHEQIETLQIRKYFREAVDDKGEINLARLIHLTTSPFWEDICYRNSRFARNLDIKWDLYILCDGINISEHLLEIRRYIFKKEREFFIVPVIEVFETRDLTMSFAYNLVTLAFGQQKFSFRLDKSKKNLNGIRALMKMAENSLKFEQRCLDIALSTMKD